MDDKTYIFEKAKIPKAVFYLAIPTIISQLITIIYNWADTFFVGQLNNTNQLAAVTICHPAFMMTTALANLLGIGGASAISRALGEQNCSKIKKISTTSVLGIILISLIYSLIVLIFKEPLLYLLGADELTFEYANNYLFWVVIIGTLPSVLNYSFAHLIRSTGKAKIASIGIALGGIINIILDPIFIFGFNMEIIGAAIATCISNAIASVFFIIYLYISRKDSILDFSINNMKIKEPVVGDILSSGISAFLLTLMAIFSNASINNLMSEYSPAAISGVSIAKKIDLCIIAFSQGLAHGILPLVGYNYASKNLVRMKKVILFSISVAVSFATCCVILFSIFPTPLVSLFINDSETISYASDFLRIMCLSMPLTSLIFIFNAVFQATKKTGRALTTTLLRKGIIDIPLMIILNTFIPIYGVVMSQPLVDVGGSIIAIILFITFLKKENRQMAL